MKCNNVKILFIIHCSLFIILSSCSVSKQISKQANTILLKDSAISSGHIGISIYEPATNKYWYNYDATHYFIPASNTKLFSLYAGMKYLGDSLVGIVYQNFNDTLINIIATGDPTFLHPDFKNQPVLNFLKAQSKTFRICGQYNDNALGYGWAWDDYSDDYMAERNIFPVYGNVVKVGISGFDYFGTRYSKPNWNITPKYFENFIDSEFVIDKKYWIIKDTNIARQKTQQFTIKRDRTSNKLQLYQGISSFSTTEIPFFVNGIETSIEILRNQFGFKIIKDCLTDNTLYGDIPEHLQLHAIKSQPSDSLFKLMMHRSDNFFAEQTLVMVNQKRRFGNNRKTSTESVVDTILTTDLKDIPQRPKWVDGSGLSRYNLFTPQSFVYILNKMKNEFGMNRMKTILATGGEGTISSYYKKDAGFIYAKTGTLSNNCALSGYLITNKGKLLIFSVLANNYITGATPVRRAVEKFLQQIRQKY